MDDETAIRTRFEKLAPFLNERTRRLFTAAEAAAIGRGGITAVTRATGVSRRTIAAGLAELQAPHEGPAHRLRRPGGGRKRCVQVDHTLQVDLERLKGHPDRHAQCAFINTKVQAALRAGEPVISVDAKKKEWVGAFKNAGREWQPAGHPVPVRVDDVLIPALGRVTPSGIYDIARNTGWVNVGTDHDTAAFAVESMRRWWYAMGQATYPQAKTLLLTADGGGSHGSRVRLWKRALQQLADETGLELAVCHFPPGTSKWNKIEHRRERRKGCHRRAVEEQGPA